MRGPLAKRPYQGGGQTRPISDALQAGRSQNSYMRTPPAGPYVRRDSFHTITESPPSNAAATTLGQTGTRIPAHVTSSAPRKRTRCATQRNPMNTAAIFVNGFKRTSRTAFGAAPRGRRHTSSPH